MKKLVAALFVSLTVVFAASFIAGQNSAFAAEQKAGAKAQKPVPVTVKDLVCGMDVETKDAKWIYEYKGQKYYFCMKSDMETFKKEPEKYIRKDVK